MRPLIILILYSVLQASSCKTEKGECPANFLDKSDDRLTFLNNSNRAITFTFSYDYPQDSNRLEMLVPTALTIDANPFTNVPANNTFKYISPRTCWEGVYRNYIPSGKLRILIFEIDSVKALPPSEIISRKLYKNYLYTLDELKAINWNIVYP